MFVRSYSFHVSHQYTLHVIIIGGETTHRRCLVDMVKIKPHNKNYPIGQKCYQTSDVLSAVTLLLHSCMQITEKKAFEL